MYGGASFPDENFILKHDAPGLLSMVSIVKVTGRYVLKNSRTYKNKTSVYHTTLAYDKRCKRTVSVSGNCSNAYVSLHT